MKKRYLSILAVLVMFCIALVGCGGGSADSAEAPAEQTSSGSGKLGGTAEVEEEDFTSVFAGEWQAIYMDADDPEDAISEEEIQQMRDLGYTMDLSLNEDGTWHLVIFGEDFGGGTWEAESATEATMIHEDKTIDLAYDDSKRVLSLAETHDTIYFIRLEEAPAASSGSAATSSPASDYELFDAAGAPTLYSIVELDGSDLAAALSTGGYGWEEDGLMWFADDSGAAVFAMGENDHEFTQEEMMAFEPNAKGTPCVLVIVVTGQDYSSAEDVFTHLNNIETVAEQWVDEGFGAAIVEGPSGEQSFVIISYNEDSDAYFIDCFNDDAAGSGILEEYLGDDYGSSIDEVRSNLF